MKKILFLFVLAFFSCSVSASAGVIFDPILGKLTIEPLAGAVNVNSDSTIDFGTGTEKITVQTDGSIEDVPRFMLDDITESPTESENSIFLLNSSLTFRRGATNYTLDMCPY